MLKYKISGIILDIIFKFISILIIIFNHKYVI